ncbi:zinc-binding dehydrogenase [Saccharomonospora azurea]|uniref:zinc-binding dehydrogenase n=1 Tax=Saccharomonospora azurea TaxID=40988 RepID=UPI0002F70ED7|nr:zinc-binding dehydrogenase [Saccharomonospora azurea]
MRVVRMTGFGGPEVLVPGEAPDPEPDAGQVVVRVAYANITFVETQYRRGPFGPFQVEPPLVPGNGVGGVVTRVGTKVDPGLIGERVVASLTGSGGYAEQVAVDAAALLRVPDGVGLDDAVAVLADGRTALLVLDSAGVGEGERVLVEAAGGGVGSLLVQLARAKGATVVAAAGDGRKRELAADLGAEVTVDYRDDRWIEDVRRRTGGVDVVFDAVGGAVGRAAFDLLGPGGRFVPYGAAGGVFTEVPAELADERGISVVSWSPGEPSRLRDYARQALTEVAQGRLRPVIGQRFPLERAADAHALIESRQALGKTLLDAR